MRTLPLGTLLLVFSITSALAGIFFQSLSWIIVSLTVVCFFVYAHLRFSTDIERTELLLEREVLDEMIFSEEAVSIKTIILNKSETIIQGTFEDQIPVNCKISAGNNKETTVIPPRSLFTFSYSLIPEKRGLQRISGMRVERVDAFGLFIEEQQVDYETIINVHTRKKSFDVARKIAGREHLEYSGIAKNLALVLRELEFDGTRDYMPGDRARDIDWKQYSKLNKLMTKIYKKEGSLQTMIFVDGGRSMRISGDGISKIDHAIDLSMQLSNVLLGSFHAAGLAIFDEVSILKETPPALGRHQFEKIIKILRETPTSIEATRDAEAQIEVIDESSLRANSSDNDYQNESAFFLETLDDLSVARTRKKIGLEGAIKTLIARGKGQKQFFVIITDLISSRDAILSSAKLCQLTGNKMLVLHTYDDWYGKYHDAIDIISAEKMYENLSNRLKIVAMLKRMGISYMRIGPADSTVRIVRAIRRGKA